MHRITKEINDVIGVNRTFGYRSDGRLDYIKNSDSTLTQCGYDQRGRLSSFGSTNYTYDNFGNRISKKVGTSTTSYAYKNGSMLTSAAGVTYSYNAFGVRCKKIKDGKTTIYYLDGEKILGEDGPNYKLRYFYDITGLRRIRKIGNYTTDYECVKDGQGNIIMLVTDLGTIACRYEYDIYGNCSIIQDSNGVGNMNPFRWKSYYCDDETGFYYINGRYYDPEIGMYIDAMSIADLIENSSTTLDRYSIMCNNTLELGVYSYDVFTTIGLTMDPAYNPGKTWWQTIVAWWNNLSYYWKIGIALVVLVSLTIATIATGGTAGGLWGAAFEGALQGAMIGGISGAVVSGTINGVVSSYYNQDFASGFFDGAVDGFVFGTISGAISGGISSYSNYGNFGSVDKLSYHYEKHGIQMGYESSADYAKDAKYVIRHGHKVTYTYNSQKTIGYIKFWGTGKSAGYAFVGMNGTYTATYEVRRISDLIKLGIMYFQL